MPQGPCRPTVCSAKSRGPERQLAGDCLSGQGAVLSAPSTRALSLSETVGQFSGHRAGYLDFTKHIKHTVCRVSVSRDSMQVIAGSLGSQPIGGSGPSGLRLCLERFKGAIINKTFSVFFFLPLHCTQRRIRVIRRSSDIVYYSSARSRQIEAKFWRKCQCNSCGYRGGSLLFCCAECARLAIFHI